ncbi:MAG: hypothetical protein HXY22_11720 [Alphaproteobacteria bacterium]|nr:hypothetical protein [Alphaproteobacteria bacterium]
MRKRGWILAVSILGAFVSQGAMAAAEKDGPPYTEAEFFALAGNRVSTVSNERLEDWWSRQPAYLKTRILSNETAYWWPIILCNYLGFDEQQKSSASTLIKCETDRHEASQRAEAWWTPDGRFIGPSEECLARGKRDLNGTPICD